MSDSRLVTPDRAREQRNWCDQRLRSGYCGCWPARYSGWCQSCKLRINLNDCIEKYSCGWGHTECPIGRGVERGRLTIENGFNVDVDYGNSFLNRIATSETMRMLEWPTPCRLEFEHESENEGDMKMPALGSKRRLSYGTRVEYDEGGDDSKMPASGSRRPPKVTQDEDEHSAFSDYVLGQSACKKAKHEDVTSLVVADVSSEGGHPGDYADQKRTDEQMAILSHEPMLGDVVAVNALAGCGKTTTAALLCNKIHDNHPGESILYLVFNSALEEEANQSNKFPKDNMEIRTTHSYVQRNYFGVANMNNVHPVGDYTLDSIVQELDLTTECERLFKNVHALPVGPKRKRLLDRRVKTIAGFIRKTLNNFQASDEGQVTGKHVPSRARTSDTKRTKWRQQIKAIQYVRWATQFFERVQRKCVNIKYGFYDGSNIGITYDAYIKVAQLNELHIPHDYIFIDEAQDMTACQASLYWGQHQRHDKRIYLIGDRHQQIYGFRGASQSFHNMVSESRPKFSLTGSFRFGKNVAACASCVLKALGGEVLHGRSNDPGIVAEASPETLDGGVVICRTQNGILKHLFAKRPSRWCNLSGKCDISLDPKPWQLDLESFMKLHLKDESDKQESENDLSSSEDEEYESAESASVFKYKGEKMKTLDDLEEYIDDEGDIELGKAVTLLKFLIQQGQPLSQFYGNLRNSFHPMLQDETPDQYDGIVMTTVHKAKGLEFECPVLISDDFLFKAINSAVVNRKAHCNEANLLYVAITRAKRLLYLTEKVKACLQKLSEFKHVQVQLPILMSLDSSREKVAAWQREWTSFKQSSQPIESASNVPYPPDWNSDTYPLALHPDMTVSEQRKQLRTFLLIYHSDKFFQYIVGREKSESVEAEIKNIIKQVATKCTENLVSLRGEDEDVVS